MRGWLAKIAAERKVVEQVRYYAKFQSSVTELGRIPILPFDGKAAEQFESLRSLRLGVGTMDLKIASICLVHGVPLLSRNLRDFERVPGLMVEDWLD